MMRSATSCLTSGVPVDAAIVKAARALVDQADLLCTHTVAEFAQSRAVRDDGFRNVSEWLAFNTHARPTEGEARVSHAKVLAELACWGEAAAAGTVGVNHIGVIAHVLNRRRLPYLQRGAEMLLRHAQTLTLRKFRQVVTVWASYCDDALGDPTDEKELHDARRVQLSPTSGGMWILTGLLDSIGGEALLKALESAMPKP